MDESGNYSKTGNEIVPENIVSEKQDELAKLTELVESQIANIFGGIKAYSQYTGYHGKG